MTAPLNGRGVPCVLDADTAARLAADGKIAQDDAYAVAKFAEFLTHAGPPPPARLPDESDAAYADRRTAWRFKQTPEQRGWWAAALADPEWREFLGLPAVEAATP